MTDEEWLAAFEAAKEIHFTESKGYRKSEDLPSSLSEFGFRGGNFQSTGAVFTYGGGHMIGRAFVKFEFGHPASLIDVRSNYISGFAEVADGQIHWIEKIVDD
ncbi:MAG: hypothetical protein AAF585_15075 [Verrucomicrobiota bacterium]